MLKVSQEEIIFIGKEKAKNLIIINQFNNAVLEASPNFGLIKASTSLSLLIKSSSLAPFQAKLQIVYTIIKHNPGVFQIQWASINKKQLCYKSIIVKRFQNINSSKLINKLQETSTNNKQIDQWHEMYRQQKMMNKKLKQQLQITQERLKQINQERLQIKVNKSIGIICDEYHTSFTTLLLLGVFSFVAGFILSKFD